MTSLLLFNKIFAFHCHRMNDGKKQNKHRKWIKHPSKESAFFQRYYSQKTNLLKHKKIKATQKNHSNNNQQLITDKWQSVFNRVKINSTEVEKQLKKISALVSSARAPFTKKITRLVQWTSRNIIKHMTDEEKCWAHAQCKTIALKSLSLPVRLSLALHSSVFRDRAHMYSSVWWNEAHQKSERMWAKRSKATVDHFDDGVIWSNQFCFAVCMVLKHTQQ